MSTELTRCWPGGQRRSALAQGSCPAEAEDTGGGEGGDTHGPLLLGRGCADLLAAHLLQPGVRRPQQLLGSERQPMSPLLPGRLGPHTERSQHGKARSKHLWRGGVGTVLGQGLRESAPGWRQQGGAGMADSNKNKKVRCNYAAFVGNCA